MVKNIIIGEDLIDKIPEYDVILIGASIKNTIGYGFFRKLCRNFPDVYKKHKETRYDDKNKLGTCQVVTTYVKQGFPIFVICYITKGRYRPDVKPDCLDYNALRSCLELVNSHFKGKKVGSTLIGNSIYDGGGDSLRIYDIIKDTTDDIDLDIYDYEQQSILKEDSELYNSIKKLKPTMPIEEFRKKIGRYYWEQVLGKYLFPFPEDLTYKQIYKKAKEIRKSLV